MQYIYIGAPFENSKRPCLSCGIRTMSVATKITAEHSAVYLSFLKNFTLETCLIKEVVVLFIALEPLGILLLHLDIT